MSAYFRKPEALGQDPQQDDLDSQTFDDTPSGSGTFSGTSPSSLSGFPTPSDGVNSLALMSPTPPAASPGGGSALTPAFTTGATDGPTAGTDSTPLSGPSSSASGSTSATISKAGNGLVFVDSFDSTCTQAFINCVEAAQETYLNLFNNSITLDFNFTETNKGNTGDLATNNWSWSSDSPVSYTTLKNALEAKAAAEPNNIYLQDAVASLPASDPSQGAGFHLPSEYAQMLGLTSSSTADSVTLNTYYSWDFGQDVINTMEHEMSEGGMGRVGGLGVQNSAWSTMDLFSYNASGSPDYSTTDNNRVFSYNGGVTTSASQGLYFFEPANGDAADYRESDVYGTGSTGETNYLSQTDLEMMAVLGWQRAPVDEDLTGDATSDILFWNSSAGAAGEWLMQNGQVTTGQEIASVGPNSGWSVAGEGDFNGNGVTDLLYYNSSTGEVGEWFMSNGQLSSSQGIGSVGTGSGWSIVGTGDFTGNGTDDILFYNSGTGIVGEWLMSNGALSSSKTVGSVGAGSGWTVVGTGDFNDNGIDDILFYNSSTGSVGEWLMNSSGQVASSQTLGSLAGSGWSVAGTGDFSGTGTSDILFYNSSTGTVGEWLMQNGSVSSATTIGSLGVGSGWSIVGTGQFTGNGISDILFFNSNTNALGEWEMQGGKLLTAQNISVVSSGWQVAHA